MLRISQLKLPVEHTEAQLKETSENSSYKRAGSEAVFY